jgi:hypothetical protein
VIVNDLKKGTTFSIGTPSDLKWILKEKLEKLLGFEFESNVIGILLGICQLG